MSRWLLKTDIPLYFNGALPELPTEDLHDLVLKHRTDSSPEIREKLINSQIGLTLTVASMYVSKYRRMRNEIVSDALFSMVKAIDRFPKKAKDNDIAAYIHKTTWYNLKQAVLRNKLIAIPHETLRRKLKQGTLVQQDVVSIIGTEKFHTTHNHVDEEDYLNIVLTNDVDRRILKMRVAKYTGKEISDELKVKVSYVYSRLNKIRETLQLVKD